MDLTNPALDFVEIAHGMGVSGRRVTHPADIQAAVREALALEKPYVLDILMDGRVPA
jgi:thiamine pyrophosphate-dependent acetolactate synthase large subunit-like protein